MVTLRLLLSNAAPDYRASFTARTLKTGFVSASLRSTSTPRLAPTKFWRNFRPKSPIDPQSGDKLILPAGVPVAAAEAFVKYRASLGDTPLLWHHRGAFYRWMGTHYEEYEEAALERDLYMFLNGVLAHGKNNTIAPYNPTKGKVLEIVHALKRGCMIPTHWDPPCWLGKPAYRPASNLVACRNGILNLETRELQPVDPLFFTANCMPLDYDAKARKPKRWLRFLEELWPADKEGRYDAVAEKTLQEIAGYLLTPDTRQQKIF